LIHRLIQQSNHYFGHHWAVLLNPGDAASYSQFLAAVRLLNQEHVKFWIDAYTSDIEHYTSQWAYTYKNPPNIQFGAPYVDPYAVMLSPAQLSQVQQVAPTTFAGLRFHEVPYRTGSQYNPKVEAVEAWAAASRLPVYINGGPTSWNQSWLPYIKADASRVVPLVNNNWYSNLEGNYQFATSLLHQGTVSKLGWSTQTFYILPLSKFQVSVSDIFNQPGDVPALPYFFYFPYEYSYGGTVFEVEPDQAIYSPTGALTTTGQQIVRFYQWFQNAPRVRASQLGHNAYGVMAVRQDGKNRVTWMGPMQVTTVSNLASTTLTVSYNISGLPPASTALMAVWNGTADAHLVGVMVNGRRVLVAPEFRGLANPGPLALWSGGRDAYVKTGNGTVTLTYQTGQPTTAPTPELNRGQVYQLVGLPTVQSRAY
jgi:hypothetical protein